MNEGRKARQAKTTTSRRLSLQGTPLEVPDHELIGRIGRGSYGEVWLVRNLLGGFRAVKFVERNTFSESRPFEREFAGIKKFEPISRTHPGFINILHAGRSDRHGYFYYIMEIADDVVTAQTIKPQSYVPRTLGSDLVRRKVLPLAQCLQVGSSLAGALKHLHQHGLVHRDIKPSNIIFVHGLPKLADVGLVTAISEATTCLGTRGYVPPEEAGSPSADLYSLGKVLYAISTGKAPEQFPDLPTALVPTVEGGEWTRFNEVLLKACETDPRLRYHSAEAMRVALGRCLPEKAMAKPIADESHGESAQGERKLLTALVINLVTKAYADPENVQSFMRACLDMIHAAVQRYEGNLAQVLGDGALVTFGGAVAVEDHARRATHAALEVAAALEGHRKQLNVTYGFDFEWRLSLNTGLAIAERDSHGRPPAGGAVNLASRVINGADPGQLLITEETWKAVQGHFVTRALGERPAHGPTAGLKLYEVLSARQFRTRLEVEAERGLTPFVGRAKELAMLREQLAEARTGQGRIVLLAGEPGVGKSRLLLQFQRSLDQNEVCCLAGRSLSFGRQMAYLPIVDLLRRLFLIDETAEPAKSCIRIETEAEALGNQAVLGLPFIKYLLSMPTPNDQVAALDPEQRRIKTFESVRHLLLQKALKHPLILVFEDLHWFDRTSEEFLVSLADSLTTAPILMLLTYRPGYRNPFPERSFITRLMLQPLSQRESLQLATQVLAVTQLPDFASKLIIEKAEGNPFFVEELIKSLVERGALLSQRETAGVLAQIQVPDTIQDVIMSRIDRLDDSPRRTLQLASVIGREFSVRLLETIADLSEPLVDSLQKLKGLELIYERSIFPEYTCFFKHALTQEVAYNSLLLQRRKELHCLVAAAIEELHSDRLPEFYQLLAYHYEHGEEWERALDYLQRAAQRSGAVGGHREEASQLSRALAIAHRLGLPEIITDLRGRRGAAWVKVGRWSEARPELEAALADLPAESLGRRAELLVSMAAAHFWALDTPGTQRCAEEGHALATQAGREDLVAELLTYLGASQQALGNLSRATELFELARAKGAGCFSAALANYPLTLYLSGRLSESLERAREAAEKFRNLSDVLGATFGHPHLGLALAGCGRYSEAARVFEEAKELGVKHEIWQFHARAIAMSAGFHLDVFDLKGHEALAAEARERARSSGFWPSEVSAAIDLIFNFGRRGEIARAEGLAKEAAALIARIGGWHEWLWNLRLKQARAELAYARRDWPSALSLAHDAISESRARCRIKYVVVGLETRANTLRELGHNGEAAPDLREAVRLARSMGDPALFLRVAISLLRTEGDEALLAEARSTATQIFRELPNEEMRRQFQTAEPISCLGHTLDSVA